jgi:simple sugar transport system permease protein
VNHHARLALLTVGAVVLVWLALAIAGLNPLTTLGGVLEGSIGSKPGWRETLKEMTPLLLAGLAVFVALRAGLFNIGAEGQILVGALAATSVALNVHGVAGIWLAILAAMTAGSLWAMPAVLIRVYRGGHEVITTIMLNSIAALLCSGLVKGPLKDPEQQSATTALIDPSTFLPSLYQEGTFRINFAWLVAVLVVAGFAVWHRRTVAGYELSAVGESPKAAATAGINVRRVQIVAMAASGALSGLAGSMLVLGHEHHFFADFSAGYGFDALGVALLAGNSAPALFGGAFVFAVIGRGVASVTGISRGLTGIILGLLILVFAAWRSRKRALAAL